MKRESINIRGESYQIGFSFRAIREYELLTGKSITQCESTWDNLLFFYSTLRALNKDFTMSLDEFTDLMDEEKELLIQFQTASQGENQGNRVKKKLIPKQIFGLWMLLLLLLFSPVLIPTISMIAWILVSLWLLIKLLISPIKKIGRKQG